MKNEEPIYQSDGTSVIVALKNILLLFVTAMITIYTFLNGAIGYVLDNIYFNRNIFLFIIFIIFSLLTVYRTRLMLSLRFSCLYIYPDHIEGCATSKKFPRAESFNIQIEDIMMLKRPKNIFSRYLIITSTTHPRKLYIPINGKRSEPDKIIDLIFDLSDYEG